jgi:hypothetical protein
MALGKRLINTGGVAACTTDSTDPFGDSSGVALYNLDYDASTAPDGTDYSGTPTDVTFGVGGNINYGARFNGSSSKIELPSALSDGSTTAATCISFWFNVGAEVTSSTTNNEIMQFAGTSSLTGKIALGSTSGHMSGETFSVTHNVSGVYTYSQTNIPAGWNHAVVQWNSSDGKWDIYINSVKHTTYTVGTNAQGFFKLKFGNRSSVYYTGSLDQVRIFNRALDETTSGEISALYAEQACVYTSTTDIVNYPTGTTPVAYYKLDNSSEDFSTGGNDGTDTNIEYRFGRFGQAAKFPALASSYINTGITSLGSDFSLSFWFNPDYIDGSAGYRAPLGKYYSGSGDAELLLTFYDNGNVTTYIYYGGGTSNSVSHTHTTTVSNGNWYHYCLTWEDGVALKTYIDTVATTTTTSQTKNTNTVPLYIGALDSRAAGDSSYNAYAWSGFIDQVRIYSTALDSDQVTELYNEKPETDTSNFKTVLYKGTSATQYISNVGMDLETDGGLVWIKSRDTGYHHRLFDSVRGLSTDGILYSNLTDEADNLPTAYDNFVSFDANGFTLGATSSTDNGSNKSGDNFVAWCWKAGGDAVTDNSGDVSAEISANTDLGFSIVKYNDSGTGGQTVAHGLNSAPEIMITKTTDTATDWVVYTTLIDGGMDYLKLNDDAAAAASSLTVPTSQFIYSRGQSSTSIINYCFHSVSGYSKIGTYEGNGTTRNVDLGFDPSWIMIKNVDTGSTAWNIVDTRRDTDTTLNLFLQANTSIAEANTTICSLITNGFSVTGINTFNNSSGDTFLYMAFK